MSGLKSWPCLRKKYSKNPTCVGQHPLFKTLFRTSDKIHFLLLQEFKLFYKPFQSEKSCLMHLLNPVIASLYLNYTKGHQLSFASWLALHRSCVGLKGEPACRLNLYSSCNHILFRTINLGQVLTLFRTETSKTVYLVQDNMTKKTIPCPVAFILFLFCPVACPHIGQIVE